MSAPWTTAETALAKRLTAQGLTSHQVSERVGRSMAAIRAHLDVAPGSAWPAERIARLRVLWDQSLSTTRIAADLGTTKDAVVGMAHRQKLAARPNPTLPREVKAQPAPRAPRAMLPTLPSARVAPPAPTPLPTARADLPRPASGATSEAPAPLSAAGLPTAGADAPDPAALFLAPPAVQPERTPRPVRGLRECIWVSGERPRYVACSEPAVPGKPFCQAHCRIGFTRSAYVAGVGRIVA
jgi:GcrA cell cycle regulator